MKSFSGPVLFIYLFLSLIKCDQVIMPFGRTVEKFPNQRSYMPDICTGDEMFCLVDACLVLRENEAMHYKC